MWTAPPGSSFRLACLEHVQRHVGECVDQFGPRGPGDDLARLPDADAASRDTQLVRNNLRALCPDDLRMHHGVTLLRVIVPVQQNITRGDGTGGNVWRMAARWQETEGTWDRLRWSRIRWQEGQGVSPNAEAAAESLGIKAGTYRAYERRPDSSKHIPLDDQTAAKFAKKFSVSWVWLLKGEGTPDADMENLSPEERRVINALREAPKDRQAAAADAITQLLKSA